MAHDAWYRQALRDLADEERQAGAEWFWPEARVMAEPLPEHAGKAPHSGELG
jgi:hypothetical protein